MSVRVGLCTTRQLVFLRLCACDFDWSVQFISWGAFQKNLSISSSLFVYNPPPTICPSCFFFLQVLYLHLPDWSSAVKQQPAAVRKPPLGFYFFIWMVFFSKREDLLNHVLMKDSYYNGHYYFLYSVIATYYPCTGPKKKSIGHNRFASIPALNIPPKCVFYC